MEETRGGGGGGEDVEERRRRRRGEEKWRREVEKKGRGEVEVEGEVEERRSGGRRGAPAGFKFLIPQFCGAWATYAPQNCLFYFLFILLGKTFFWP